MKTAEVMERPSSRAIRLAWRPAAAALATSAMVLVGCSTSSDGGAGIASSTDARAASEKPDPASLEGAWRTTPVAPRDTEETLRRQGFAQFVDDYRANAPFSKETVLILTIEDGQWNLYGEAKGEREPIDYDAEYTIDGDTVTFKHSDGSNTHRWTVDGDTLSLEFVKGTMPLYKGIPDEVFQRALYMTEVFMRQD